MTLCLPVFSQGGAQEVDSITERYFSEGKYRELVKHTQEATALDKGFDRLFFLRGVAQHELHNYSGAVYSFEKIQSLAVRKLCTNTYLRACQHMYRDSDRKFLNDTSANGNKKIEGLVHVAAAGWVHALAPPELKSLTSPGDVYLSGNFPNAFRTYSVFPEISFQKKTKLVGGYSYNGLTMNSGVWSIFGSNMRSYLWQQQDYYLMYSRLIKKRLRAGVYYHRFNTSLGYLGSTWNPASFTYSWTDGSAKSSGNILGFHLVYDHPYYLAEINPSFLSFSALRTLNLEISGSVFPLGNQKLIVFPRMYFSSDTAARRNLFYLGLGSMPLKNFWIKGGILSGSIQNQVSLAGSTFSPVPDNTRYVADASVTALLGHFTLEAKYQFAKRTLDVFHINLPDPARPDVLLYSNSGYTYNTQSIIFSLKYRP